MPLPTRRSYAGGAAACTLSSTINSSATSFSISGTTTGWPATAGGGFYMVIDPGLSTEEKVFVGARTSGSLSSVTRGVDGTLAASHDAGATCYPVFTSIDADQANKLASTMTTKGDLVSNDGSDPARLGVGTNNHRLVAASGETTGLKWVADTQNTVIDAKGDLLVGSAADTTARLAVGATNGLALVVDSAATNGIKWAETGGLVHIKTATVTNAADTGSTWQSVFTSDYNAYRLVCHTLNAHTNGANPRLSFYYSTSTEQTTTYYSSVTNSIFNGTSNLSSVNNGAYIQLGAAADNISMSGFSIDIYQVGSSGRAAVVIQYNDAYNGSWASGGGLVATTRTYDGMKFVMSTGNISMTASLYGYRKV